MRIWPLWFFLTVLMSGIAWAQKPARVSLASSAETITLPCSPDARSVSRSCPANYSPSVSLTTTSDRAVTLTYSYTVTAGRISGEGDHVIWNLDGIWPGIYTASVEVTDRRGRVGSSSTTLTIANCPDCVNVESCPPVNLQCPDSAIEGTGITIVADVFKIPGYVATYRWTVSAGTITSGQQSSSVTVDTTGLGGQTIVAKVEIGGFEARCWPTWTCSVPIAPKHVAIEHFDEYGNIRFNDEKARLDNFANQLQNVPSTTGYVVGYGGCGDEGKARANRARNYLVNTRGLGRSRVVVVDGGCRPELLITLWALPPGIPAPTGDGLISPCPICKKKPSQPRRRGHRG
jgi:hypothetical protein